MQGQFQYKATEKEKEEKQKEGGKIIIHSPSVVSGFNPVMLRTTSIGSTFARLQNKTANKMKHMKVVAYFSIIQPKLPEWK